jgi:selenium metabolism protein YedF
MATDKNTLLLLKSSGIGDGEPDLGEKLMKSFLAVLAETDHAPDRIICLNSGVFLSTEGSQVIDLLRQMEAMGSTILSCGTCLDYYDRRDKLMVGEPTTMADTVKAMLDYERILTP